VDEAGRELAASAPLTVTISPTGIAVVNPTITGPVSLAPSAPLAFEGTAAPGTQLRFFDGDQPLGEATAGPDGKWHFEPPQPLAAGKHSLRTVTVDEAGQALATSRPLAVTVDPTGVAVVDPVFASPASGTRLSSDKPPVFEGTAAPGTRLQFYVGKAFLGETIAASNGDWRFEVPGLLAEGEHTLRAVAVDQVGNVLTASEPLTITIGPAAVAGAAPVAAHPTRRTRFDRTRPSVFPPKVGPRVVGDVLEGIAYPAAHLLIYFEEILLGETIAGSDGLWHFLLPPGLDARHVALHVVIVEDAGCWSLGFEPGPIPAHEPWLAGMGCHPWRLEARGEKRDRGCRCLADLH
jgi:hypothetical protein